MLVLSLSMTVFLVFMLPALVNCNAYNVDDLLGIGRTFDGIGGLSGGSATSKLLIAYQDKTRNEILDYLFKPKFAASLQILKVEIGGDAQASDATEQSHMHVEWEENYERGYEWWLMKEAKQRNPNIKLYGLPWAFPGWLGSGTQNPYIDKQRLANYIYKWINGALIVHNLTIDYIGIWNEMGCDQNYVKILRDTLDQNGFMNTRIVACDSWWSAATNIVDDASVSAAIDVLGVHYPGVPSPAAMMVNGKVLWSSEDYSTYNDETGGGCWARILNQNYVQGLMTSTIAWNLIDSFYETLPWDRDSLMTAREPWSGNYIVESPIWMTAHTTQLTEIGWKYLPHGHGVGMLVNGGSYVTLVSPDLKDLTIVIETMSHNHSVCIRPGLPQYVVTPQNITFTMAGSFANLSKLFVWQSTLRFNGQPSTCFQKAHSVQVINGQVTIYAEVDQMISLSTLNDASHGVFPDPPPSAPFPLPYVEDFEAYPLAAEPYYFAPQQGSFDVVDVGGDHGKVMRQMVLETPVVWCESALQWNSSVNLVGWFNWTDVYISADVKIGAANGSNGFFVAVRIDDGGCTTYKSKGIFFYIFPKDKKYILSNDIMGKKVITSGQVPVAIKSDWNTITLFVQGLVATGTCNGVQLFNIMVPANPKNGLVGVGTDIYGYADFDNIHVDKATDSSSEFYLDRNKQEDTLYFVKEKL